MTRKTLPITAPEVAPPRRRHSKTTLTALAVAMIAFGVVVFTWLPTKAVQAAPAISIYGNIGAHDPSRMIKDGNTYYVYATGYDIPSLTSTDRIHWTQGKPVLTNGTPSWARKAFPETMGTTSGLQMSFTTMVCSISTTPSMEVRVLPLAC